jgi:hypothetical protein
LPSRIARAPTASPEPIRALIRSDPAVIEHGLRLFDFDFKMGPEATIDALGVDRSGRLALVAVASSDPDAALARLLDGHLWVADQRDLLGRLYAERGVNSDRPARGFLLAPSFTHAFLRRLALLSVEVAPCLAREIERGDGARLTIVEPAAPLFGLVPVERRAGADADRDDAVPFWPEGVLPSDETAAPAARSDARGEERSPAVAEEASGAVQVEEMPWPDLPEERFPWELDAGQPANASVEVEAGGAGPEHPGAFETLTVEELEEFERFERQRRERGRRSS